MNTRWENIVCSVWNKFEQKYITNNDKHSIIVRSYNKEHNIEIVEQCENCKVGYWTKVNKDN